MKLKTAKNIKRHLILKTTKKPKNGIRVERRQKERKTTLRRKQAGTIKMTRTVKRQKNKNNRNWEMISE